ncbi:MobF family relaxase [Geobacter sp. FeAm09]|uniref:MobF family relaxase n=1 Tax=Geobacter sp. FeAm09 TaxID=2597769 RepID=UPI001F0F1A62|nr:MobF family relaxase [Geobacter sp. FeAm09]
MKITAGKAAEYYYQADPVFGDGAQGNGVWLGGGAEALGLAGTVDLEQFTNLLYGMSPDGTDRLVGKPADHHKNAATDIILDFPKSMSLIALYDPKFREGLKEALRETAQHVDRHIYGRQTRDGETELVKGKGVMALYFHSTSRANDVHMHGHLVNLNMVQRPDGSWSTLENRPLFVAQKENQQELYSRVAVLARECGYGIELSRNKGGMIVPEIAGVSREVIEQFSKRWSDIKEADKLASVLAQKLPGLNEKDINELVQLHTKAEKNLAVTEDEMVKGHTMQLRAMGTSPEQLLITAKELGSTQKLSGMTARDYIKTATTDLVEHESVVSGSKIVSEAVKISVGEMTRPELEAAFQEARMAGEFVNYGKDRFSTPEMQHMEVMVAETAVRGREAFTPLMSPEAARAAVEDFEAARGIKATDGQTRSIEYVLTGSGRLMLIQGDAGAGKSTAFAAIFASLKDREDVTARGFGFQGKAAAELQRSSGLSSQTIDSFLLSKPTEDTGRQLWVVDEASMVGSRHLHGMMERALQENAQIVLVGDGKQIAAIAAGKLFLDLQEHGLVESSRMEEIQRQKTGYTKEIAAHLKNHDVGAAFSVLDREGNIYEIKDREERIQFAAERYVAAGKDALIMTVTNRDRKDLIEAIRAMEKACGRIGEEDHVFNVRTPVNLIGIDKRLAASYEPGNMVFLRDDVAGLRRGSEAQIIERDTGSNTIRVRDVGGREHDIDLRRHGGDLSQFEEKATPFSIGEKVMWTKNDNSEYGKNNSLKNSVAGHLQVFNDDGTSQILTEHGNLVKIQMEGAYITNGQGATIDKAQGVTAEFCITMMPSDAPAELLSENKNYVAMTRMTHELELITDSKEDLLEMVDDPQIKTSTLEHMSQRIAELKESAEQSLADQREELEHLTDQETSANRQIDRQLLLEQELNITDAVEKEHEPVHDHDHGHDDMEVGL